MKILSLFSSCFQKDICTDRDLCFLCEKCRVYFFVFRNSILLYHQTMHILINISLLSIKACNILAALLEIFGNLLNGEYICKGQPYSYMVAQWVGSWQCSTLCFSLHSGSSVHLLFKQRGCVAVLYKVGGLEYYSAGKTLKDQQILRTSQGLWSIYVNVELIILLILFICKNRVLATK